MRCKYNNSMYTLDIPENMEFDEFDIYEDVQEPVDDIDYSFADQEGEDSVHLQNWSQNLIHILKNLMTNSIS